MHDVISFLGRESASKRLPAKHAAVHTPAALPPAAHTAALPQDLLSAPEAERLVDRLKAFPLQEVSGWRRHAAMTRRPARR